MHSRTISDQATAGVIGTLAYGVCALLAIEPPVAIAVAVAVYAALISMFTVYRRHLRALQPAVCRPGEDALAPVVGAIDLAAVADAAAAKPGSRRRRLHAA